MCGRHRRTPTTNVLHPVYTIAQFLGASQSMRANKSLKSSSCTTRPTSLPLRWISGGWRRVGGWLGKQASEGDVGIFNIVVVVGVHNQTFWQINNHHKIVFQLAAKDALSSFPSNTYEANKFAHMWAQMICLQSKQTLAPYNVSVRTNSSRAGSACFTHVRSLLPLPLVPSHPFTLPAPIYHLDLPYFYFKTNKETVFRNLIRGLKLRRVNQRSLRYETPTATFLLLHV